MCTLSANESLYKLSSFSVSMSFLRVEVGSLASGELDLSWFIVPLLMVEVVLNSESRFEDMSTIINR